MRRRIAHVGLIALLVLLVAPLTGLAGGAMKMAAVSFPMPKQSEPIPLTGLTYGGAGGTVAVTSARLEVLSEEAEDPVRVEWKLAGSNTKPQMRRVELKIFLLNGEEKRIASARRTVMFRGADEAQEFVLEMKVKAGTWAAAERIYLQASFLSR